MLNGNKFPLEKIESISFEEYCERVGRMKEDYWPPEFIKAKSENGVDIKFDLSKRVPNNAEHVIKYKVIVVDGNDGLAKYASGFALIPKNSEN